MTIQYEGKSPSRLWYARQKIKAVFASGNAGAVAKPTGLTALSTTCLIGITKFNMAFMQAVPYLSAAAVIYGGCNAISAWRNGSDYKKSKDTPKKIRAAVLSVAAGGLLFSFAPAATFWVSTAFVAMTAWSAFTIWKNTGDALTHQSAQNYIKQQEKKWLEKKSRGGLMKRLGALSARLGTVAGYGLAAAGVALATAAALELGGVIAAGTIAAAIGSIVALPAIIAVGIAAACIGAGTGFACNKAAAPKSAQNAPAAPSAKQSPGKALTDSSSAPSFEKAASPTNPEAAERERQAAAARAAARKANRKLG